MAVAKEVIYRVQFIALFVGHQQDYIKTAGPVFIRRMHGMHEPKSPLSFRVEMTHKGNQLLFTWVKITR